MFDLTTAAPAAATLPLFLPQAPADKVSGLIHAATLLTQLLGQGRAIDSRTLRSAMETAFCGSDAEGVWVWKDAYEALEAAQVMFLRKFGAAMRTRAGSSSAMLEMLTRLAGRLPTQTRRSEESEQFQQFSTPLALGFVAAEAAMLTAADLVLEPSAGTGMLAIFAEIARACLVLNEIADTRAGLLARLFREAPVTRHNAEQIHDWLDPAIRPSVVLMNPPFSASPHVAGRFAEAAMRHVSSALARLADGGRLVAITGHNVGPDQLAWREAFVRLQEKARVVFTAPISGKVYARHGTTFDTRLTVIDRVPAEDPRSFPASPGLAADAGELLTHVAQLVPPRPSIAAPSHAPAMFQARAVPAARPKAAAPQLTLVKRPVPAPDCSELAYETCAWTPGATQFTASLYEGYALQSIRIADARPHPTKLVQSAAMASVAPPRPSYRPLLPPRLLPAGILSDAQLESVIYAGEAHAGHLAGSYTVDETYDLVSTAPDGAENAVRFRRGWFLGDGTGAGKGRQVAAIILDNWLKGRRKAVWISKSDKLIEDAERDWTAVGGYRSDIVPLSRFRQGAAIALDEGILFTTYATLRTQAKGDKVSRVQQIVDWLGRDFDGVIVFDEAHAMANAAGDKTERGEKKPSQQGQAGLRLQHALHDARILYVSATGATTVQNLAYAARLGLWGTGDFPFATRADFVSAMEKGGVAAMEVLARDLKALGLYAARSLSFEGIEYEIVEHQLTSEQIRIYDAYADAFQIIHRHLTEALKAANITGSNGDAYNRNAKAAARSAFESNKQRFFNHLLSAMKCPTLIASIARDLEAGHACVLQVVSTNEALLDRRLAEIPSSEWADLSIDITPREYVLCRYRHNTYCAEQPVMPSSARNPPVARGKARFSLGIILLLGHWFFLPQAERTDMTTGMLVSTDLRVMEVGTTARNELVLGFLDHLRGTRAAGTLWSYGAAARHFLFWLAQRGIPVISVDDTVVGRFARHRCRCHRYNPRALSGPLYLSRVRKFVCFLEERGDIPTNDNLDATAHLADFADHLDAVGYSGVSRRGYRSEAEHFACWLRLMRVQWRDVNDEVVDRFTRHDCHCPIRRKRGVLADRTGSAHRRRGASRFIGFLQRRAVILPVGRRSEPVEDPRLSAFRVWLKHHRGASGETVRRYLQEASRWLPALGVDPTVYDAATIRNVVLDQDPGRSRASVQMTTTVLRSYLRFLAARGECRPELVHAVPPAPRRRLATLPRYVGPAVIERIIASCDAATPIGIRDRAIILLLARLGLRAGDIWRLRIADIDWAGALLHLYGKGRRSVSLPLPQDVGDALLVYLEQARPKVSEERVFLRIQAPFTPFLSSSEIAGIVARVLARGGIDGVPTGAHLFRHSLATAMLRAGGSLESVGAVLRHRTPHTTAIYAKVDVAMLESVAQPWPGEVPC